MKKILSFILAISLVFSLFCFTAYASKGGNGKGNSADPKAKTEYKSTETQKKTQDSASTQSKAASKPIQVMVKGQQLKMDAPPVIKYGRTLIPVRAITNGLKAQLEWDKETGTITITKDDITIVLTMGSSVATVNGKEVELGAPADVINNRTYVPIRFIAETLKQKVDWDQDTGSVIIDDGSGTTTDDTGTTTPGSTDTNTGTTDTSTNTTTDTGTGTTDGTTTTPTDSSSTGTTEVPSTNP